MVFGNGKLMKYARELAKIIRGVVGGSVELSRTSEGYIAGIVYASKVIFEEDVSELVQDLTERGWHVIQTREVSDEPLVYEIVCEKDGVRAKIIVTSYEESSVDFVVMPR